MNEILTFISSLIASISWPLAVVVIVLYLKQPLSKLLNRLGKIKYGELEAEFSKGMEEIKENITKLPEGRTIRIGGSAEVVVHYNRSLFEEVDEIAKISPEAAIPYAWSRIEYALNDKLTKMDMPILTDRTYSSLKIADLLYKNEKIDGAALSVIQTMGKLRNAVVHSYNSNNEISYIDAINYGKNAEIVISSINKIE